MQTVNRNGTARLGAAMIVLLILASTSARAEFETPTAITGVTIITGAGQTIDTGTIVMADGRIVDVGPEVTIPPHAKRIDATGLFAYPGFIDAHTHLGLPDKPRPADERVLTEDVNPDRAEGPLPATRYANRRGIDPQYRSLEHYVPDEEKLAAWREAGFTAALVAPRFGILAGTSDLISLSDDPVRRAVIAPDIAMHGSFEPGEEGNYPRSLLGVFAQFRQFVADARRHVKLQKYSERHTHAGLRPPTDPALDAVQPMLARAQPLVFEANTENEINRAINLAAEFNLDLVITGGKEAWKVADRIKDQRVNLVLSLKFDKEPEFGRKKEQKPQEGAEQEPQAGSEKGEKIVYEPLKLRKERRRLWAEQVDNAIRLHEAGIDFALRTNDFDKPADFFKSLRKVVERGLPESAALRALTVSPATMLGLDRQLGSIASGRIADLALFTKPFADKDAKVKIIFIDGKKYDIEEKDKASKKKERDPQGSTDEDDEGPAPAEDAGDDSGPTWEVEIEANRTPPTRTGGNVLIKNATVIPVSSSPMLQASVLIRDGRIAAVGDVSAVPEGTTVIDATGRFVIPGLVDAHSHMATDSVNEGALAITAEVRIADTIDPNQVAIYRAVAGGATTHHVMHGSANPIGGQNVIMKLKYGRPASEMPIPDAPRTIKFALGENVTQSNWARAWGKRYPNTRMGVEATIRQALATAGEYQEKWNAYGRDIQAGLDVPPPRRDLRLEALADVLSGDLTVHAHCYRSDEILCLLAAAEDYGFRIGTLQHVPEGYRIAPEIARHGCGASTFANLWAYKIEAYGAIPYNAALMAQRGICTSVNSDSPRRIRYLAQEAAKCIKWGGLNENEALRLVTLNPARQLQIEGRVGSIDVGKDGDIAIFNGHPLNTFSKCIMTLIEGEVYFEDDAPDPVEPCANLNLPAAVNREIPKTGHRAYAITHATIHPMSGPVIEDGTVVILEDRIHAVGQDVVVPPGAGVINGTGLHVYPGLIDAGSTLGLLEIAMLRPTRDDREIGTFNPHIRAFSAVHSHSEHIRIARTTGITTTLAEPSTRGDIAGQSTLIHLDGWTAPEMAIDKSFALHMKVPSLPVHLPEDEKKKKKLEKDHKTEMKALDNFMAKARHYADVAELAETDPAVSFERDVVLEAMIPYVRGRAPVVFAVRTYKQILDTLDFAENHELRCVLSGATEAWKLAETLADKDIPVILGTPLSYPSNKFEPWDSVYRCAAELDRAGVRFCFASKSAAGAFNLPIQAGMAVAHGLPRERAEFALTLGAAQILGIADRTGSIEVGKEADLIVTTDTPLQTVSQVTHMFIDGRPIELTSMHTESYEKYKNRPAPQLPPPPDLRGPPSLTNR